MITTLVYELLNEMKMNVKEIHSKKPQIYRSRVSEEFRISKERILVTSDVSASGMNYPDVTLVIQVRHLIFETGFCLYIYLYELSGW